MSKSERRILALEREIHRIKNSPSQRIGLHITNSIRKPWKFPLLIFTLPIKIISIGMELIGRKPQPAGLANVKDDAIKRDDTIVMFPTNGVGFGHFTRMLAIAKNLVEIKPHFNIIFFTTMPTLHLLKPYGISSHHISGPKYFKHLGTAEWNYLVEEQLHICFETHKPKMFIFDGAFPYRGMLRSIENRKNMDKGWLRRGNFKKGTSIPVDSIEKFDFVINPGDIDDNQQEYNHSLPTLECNPIVLLEREELLSRNNTRKRLNIPIDAYVVYIQLGAGEINDIGSEIRMTVDCLLNYENVIIVLGESMIGGRLDFYNNRVRILRDYPNSMYLKGFDATIQAGGYNSFHETRKYGLPALFYPNMNTGMDDQLARCLVAEKEGWGVVLKERNRASIQKSIEYLLKLKPEVKISYDNGANQMAEMIINRLEGLNE